MPKHRSIRTKKHPRSPGEPGSRASVAADGRSITVGKRVLVALLALMGMLLLSVSFAPANCWLLAYVALVPWVMALNVAPTRRWALLWGWLSGLVFWAGNLYWLWWVTLVGYAALVLYLSVYWLVAAIVIRAAMRRNYPLWIVLPVVWVALEYARAYVISGFPWLYLAHSQYARTYLIQICDITGQYGVTFFVAMINGAIVDLLLWGARHPGRSERNWWRFATFITVPTVVGVAILGYGILRVRQSENTTRQGPIIGIVQRAFPISLTGRGATAQKIFEDHLTGTQRFLGRKCDLVIWPETMLPRALNPEILDLDPTALSSTDLRSISRRLIGPQLEEYSDGQLRGGLRLLISGGTLVDGTKVTGMRAQAEQVGKLSKELGCPILAGGSSIHSNVTAMNDRDRWVTRNSVLWFDQTWRASPIYSKRHLVPFSESVPFKGTWDGLHRILRKFVPPVMDQLDPGHRPVVFDLMRAGKTWRLAAPICYEGTFARVCRNMTTHHRTKRVDILVNLSNDGWFVYRWGGGGYQGSTEHAQHLVQYCFRAVENRVPIVRAVNTGISGSIDSNGRIVAKLALTLDEYKQHTMIAGTLLLNGAKTNETEFLSHQGPRVLVDSRISLYSLIGDAFAMLTSASAVLLVVSLMRRHRRVENLDALSKKGSK